MKLRKIFIWLIATILLISCTAQENQEQLVESDRVNQSQKTIVLDENFQIATGQTIYVPIYSHIYHQDEKKTFNLTATLSIRNTDLDNPIVIPSVQYYDWNGNLVRNYLEQPIEIAALASTDFVVNTTDRSGGLGAKFMVEWVAQTTVTEPIVEAIMIGTSSQQGISFVSPGRVIKRQNNSQIENPNQ